MEDEDNPTLLVRLRASSGRQRFRRLEIRWLEDRQAWGIFIQGSDNPRTAPVSIERSREFALLHRAELVAEANTYLAQGWRVYDGPLVTAATIAVWRRIAP